MVHCSEAQQRPAHWGLGACHASTLCVRHWLGARIDLFFLDLKHWPTRMCQLPYHNFLLLLSRVWPFATPQTTAWHASLSFTIFWIFLRFISAESIMPSNHLTLWCPLFFWLSIFPSIRVFSSELALCIRWSKYWSLILRINSSNEYSGLTSFRIGWFNLAVQETLKSLLQNHNSILLCNNLITYNYIIDSMDMSLSKLQEIVKEREACQTWVSNWRATYSYICAYSNYSVWK